MGSDGAVIGASKLSQETRPGLQQGGHASQPLKARAPGQQCTEKDMTWSGVTVRTDGMTSGLPGHRWLVAQGKLQLEVVSVLDFLKEPTRHCCSLDP